MKRTELSSPDAYPMQARTSYRDLEGSISIDFPGDFNRTEFKNYAEKVGVDLEKYQPVGIHIHDGENTGLRRMDVSIIAIDNELERQYQEENINKIPLVEFWDIDNFDNLRKYLHRLDIVLTDKIYDDKEMEIIARMKKEDQ